MGGSYLRCPLQTLSVYVLAVDHFCVQFFADSKSRESILPYGCSISGAQLDSMPEQEYRPLVARQRQSTFAEQTDFRVVSLTYHSATLRVELARSKLDTKLLQPTTLVDGRLVSHSSGLFSQHIVLPSSATDPIRRLMNNPPWRKIRGKILPANTPYTINQRVFFVASSTKT